MAIAPVRGWFFSTGAEIASSFPRHLGRAVVAHPLGPPARGLRGQPRRYSPQPRPARGDQPISAMRRAGAGRSCTRRRRMSSSVSLHSGASTPSDVALAHAVDQVGWVPAVGVSHLHVARPREAERRARAVLHVEVGTVGRRHDELLPLRATACRASSVPAAGRWRCSSTGRRVRAGAELGDLVPAHQPSCRAPDDLPHALDEA